MTINHRPNRQNLKIGQQVILNTADEFDGQTVIITAIKSYGFEIAGGDDKLFEFEEINAWEMSREEIISEAALFEDDTILESRPPKPAWRNDPATPRQLKYLQSLGYTGQAPASKGEASDLIERRQPGCHYCGQRATSFGFFDEPVCKECGG